MALLVKSVGIIELLTGILFVGVSAYFLLDLRACTPESELCIPLTLLPVALFLIPGVLAVAAGVTCLHSKRFTFRKIQSSLIAFLGVYYASVYAVLYHPELFGLVS